MTAAVNMDKKFICKTQQSMNSRLKLELRKLKTKGTDSRENLHNTAQHEHTCR